jgi:hypothetical protein
VLNIDDPQQFKFLIRFNMGRLDTPGVIVVKDIDNSVFYRTYETYYGNNFEAISEGLLADI